MFEDGACLVLQQVGDVVAVGLFAEGLEQRIDLGDILRDEAELATCGHVAVATVGEDDGVASVCQGIGAMLQEACCVHDAVVVVEGGSGLIG